MKSDTMLLLIGCVGVIGIVMLALALRDSNMLLQSYREAAHRATAIGESCAEKLHQCAVGDERQHAEENGLQDKNGKLPIILQHL